MLWPSLLEYFIFAVIYQNGVKHTPCWPAKEPKKLQQQQQRHQLPANANLMRHAVEKHIPFPFSEPGWQQVVPGPEFQGPDEMTSFKFMHDPHCTSGWCSICFLAFAPPSTTHHPPFASCFINKAIYCINSHCTLGRFGWPQL